jgi:cell division protein ZapB
LPRRRALTAISAITIVAANQSIAFACMTATELDALERKVTELIELCQVLSRENRALRSRQNTWSTERAKLIEKNELAKSKVESMISRLKSLEQD